MIKEIAPGRFLEMKEALNTLFTQSNNEEISDFAELELSQEKFPADITQYSLCFRGKIIKNNDISAIGKFVILYDENESWGECSTKVAVFIETEISAKACEDPFLQDVAWSWLEESLDDVDTEDFRGTTTLSLNRYHGDFADELSEDGKSNEKNRLEIRASWIPCFDEPKDIIDSAKAWKKTLIFSAGESDSYYDD